MEALLELLRNKESLEFSPVLSLAAAPLITIDRPLLAKPRAPACTPVSASPPKVK